jgi:hypothetical protein
MSKLIKGIAAFVAVASVAGLASAQGGIAIDHKAVDCIVAGSFPRQFLLIRPRLRARVYFRPEGVENGIVDMIRRPACGRCRGCKGSSAHINYYVQATDMAQRGAHHRVQPARREQRERVQGQAGCPLPLQGLGPGVRPACRIAAGGGTLPSWWRVRWAARRPVWPRPGDTSRRRRRPGTRTRQCPRPPPRRPRPRRPFRRLSRRASFNFRVSPNPPRGVEPLQVTTTCATTSSGNLRFLQLRRRQLRPHRPQCSDLRSAMGEQPCPPPTTNCREVFSSR